MQFAAMILDALAGIGELGLKTGQEDAGRKLLSFVLGHPSTEIKDQDAGKADSGAKKSSTLKHRARSRNRLHPGRKAASPVSDSFGAGDFPGDFQ